jgi:hypothetical protein
MPNPFFYGNPVAPDRFLDRQRELRRLVSRIVNRGQSTAIVGEPRSGRTSLFLYLSAPEKRTELYGENGDRLVFSYMDAQTLGGAFSQAQFWEYALRPLYERIIATRPDSPLAQSYDVCRDNDFGCFVLERLFVQVEVSGWRVVLLLDEFDVLLYHPILNSAEFFGSLRSLASRSRGALAVVIASRRSLTGLNDATQQFSRTGSPYFNFLAEVTLGPLPNNAVAELLRRAGGRFTSKDGRLIVDMAGGHPYLLQVAASELWEAYAEFPGDSKRRWRETGHRLYREALDTLTDIWRLWSPAMRKAFTVVALAEMSGLGQKKFRVKRLVRDLSDLGSELRTLREHGFVVEDEHVPGGWQVRPQVFLWWLADDLATMVRSEMPFGEWLQRQELGSMLADAEKEQWGKAVQTAGVVFKEGVKVLVEATIQGFLSGVVTGV